jgi:hypothetical protein
MISARFKNITFKATSFVLALVSPLFASAAPNVNLYQGWDKETRQLWYTSTQGSRLIPLAWLLALEQTSTQDLLISETNIDKFRYVPNDLDPKSRLPIGFAIDTTDDDNLVETRLRWKKAQSTKEPWVGMTCAACHTAKLQFKGQNLLVDGGPTLADFQSFIEEINRSLISTSKETDKFERFSKKVLDKEYSLENKQRLELALNKLISWQTDLERINHTELRYGFGRLDAVGHILNKIAKISKAQSPTLNPADAPVSYPFLWNVPQQSKVQWNGMVDKSVLPRLRGPGLDVGALGRNAGEVIGVFAEVVTKKNLSFGEGFSSSLNIHNLTELEKLLGSLKPPKWPEDTLGKLDINKVNRGATLYKSLKCNECHEVINRENLTKSIKVNMTSLVSRSPVEIILNNESNGIIQTDPWMACNALMFTSSSGVLEGLSLGRKDGPIEKTDKLADMLAVTVKHSLLDKKFDLGKAAFIGFFGIPSKPEPVLGELFNKIRKLSTETSKPVDSEKLNRKKECLSNYHPLLAYKGRPLTGIWATAPYLHNGSVPTLYDLLLPAAKRPQKFYVGSREYDPVKVGFLTEPSITNTFLIDTSIEGNLNTGHEYGVNKLTEEDRNNLVEYMKTL